ncbi:hypothetical protein D9756_010023 [Leucocoprinus leucothites]|uniref:lytic cellulose monooxygenase (C4-dehydrogenating) n=1 Tax=Leucocoprinus leucothites TaxID=201217 RepID=A0A8H5FRG9_9AGAR|nr:hypothetical protein D9756_010023 [Leucoagaricus leucothites]
MKSMISVLVPLLAAASAYAHGFVADLNIAGKDYQGNKPGGQGNPSVIRQVSENSPVKGADNPDLNCGMSAKPASLNANANPGDTISFDWKAGAGDSNWPHNTGPMLTYMASCGDTTCDKFDSTQAKWFKIQQVAYDSSGKWAQAALMTGAPADITLPSNIAPGNYLIRHEVISLQNAISKGGAEFYPSCSQLTVGGNGNGKPQDSELVSFPGAYHDDDPGIYVPNVYNGKIDYQFPGPPIASFAGGSGSGSSGGSGPGSSGGSGSGSSGGSGSGSSSDSGSGSSGDSGPSSSPGDSGDSGASPSTYGGSSTATSAGSQSTPASSGSGSIPPSKCKLKKSPNSDGAGANSRRSLDVKYYPKHVSRVMRNLAFGKAH